MSVKKPARFGLLEDSQDRIHQGSCRFGAELNRHTGARSLGFIDKIDIQCMLSRQVEGMIVRYIRLTQVEPTCRTFTTAGYYNLLGNHRTHSCAPYLRKKLRQEIPYLVPAIHSLLLAIIRAMMIKEAMTRVGIAVELVYLTMLP